MEKVKLNVCDINVVDRVKVEKIKTQIPQSREITDLAETFKVIGDSTRLQIVMALSFEELCVCDLAALINLTVSAISHQLRLLRSMKIVKYRKEGKMVYYSLDDDHIINLIGLAREHISE